jgi:Glyoxalase-like domain
MDAARPEPVARFWADALDLDAHPTEDGDWELRGVRPQRTVWINAVAEAKTVKNRVHLDINASGGPDISIDERRVRVDGEVARLREAGATVFREAEENGEYWVVMQDPEGNEFCVQ